MRGETNAKVRAQVAFLSNSYSVFDAWFSKYNYKQEMVTILANEPIRKPRLFFHVTRTNANVQIRDHIKDGRDIRGL